MKINVRYEVNETSRSELFDLEQDLGFTDEEWNKMSNDKKQEVLMDAMVEQPYWSVDRFEEVR